MPNHAKNVLQGYEFRVGIFILTNTHKIIRKIGEKHGI